MMRRLAPKTRDERRRVVRDRGERVLLIVDSATRYAHAARDVALAAARTRGGPRIRAFRLLRPAEAARTRRPRAARDRAPITGIFSVLVDGDDHNDPVADAIRGTLDGHIVLDRRIAAQGRYPGDRSPQVSLSRLATQIWSPEQRVLVTKLRELIIRFEDSRDLRAMGAYRGGTDGELDQAVTLVPRIYDAMVQAPGDAAERGTPSRDLANTLQKK